MKNKKNYVVIIGLCVAAGLFFLNNSRAEQKQYAVAASQISAIEVNDGSNQVEIVPAADETIQVTYYDKDSSSYTISVEGSTLCISNQSASGSDDVSAGISMTGTTLTIAVPASFTGTLTANTFDQCSVDERLNFSEVEVVSLSEMLE